MLRNRWRLLSFFSFFPTLLLSYVCGTLFGMGRGGGRCWFRMSELDAGAVRLRQVLVIFIPFPLLFWLSRHNTIRREHPRYHEGYRIEQNLSGFRISVCGVGISDLGASTPKED